MDDVLNVDFSYLTDFGVFDLITSDGTDAILDDFDIIKINGLAPNTNYTIGVALVGVLAGRMVVVNH